MLHGAMSAENNHSGSLEPLRKQIDALDARIVQLLNDRARVVVEIGKLKQQSKEPIYAPDREKAVLQKVRELNGGPLPDRCLEAVYRELMSGSFGTLAVIVDAHDALAVRLVTDLRTELEHGHEESGEEEKRGHGGDQERRERALPALGVLAGGVEHRA